MKLFSVAKSGINTRSNILFSSDLLPFCENCAKAVFRRTRVDQICYFSYQYGLRYKPEEQKKILQVLNESTAEELSRYSVSKVRINSLQQFRIKRGQFDTLDKVLEVDGLGVKVLEKLCDSILNGKGKDTEQISTKVRAYRNNLNQILTPPFIDNQRETLKTFVGINIGVNALSWTHMNRNGEILDWNLFSFDFGPKKLHVTSLYDVVVDICDQLPEGDLYVMEDKTVQVQSAQQPASIPISLQNCQLVAMIVAMLNSKYGNSSNNVELPESHHQVFFLRSRLSARLFGTLIGKERVSAQDLIMEFLTDQYGTAMNSENVKASAKAYTPIKVCEELVDSYLNRTSVEKENLCWSLLLTMTFLDLVVHQNPESWNVIRGNHKVK